MKKINFKFFGVLFIVFFIISASVFPQTMPMKDKFYIGYQGSYYNNTLWNNFFQGLSQLNANFVQNYGGHYEYDDTHFDGGFRDPISSYAQNVKDFLDNWYRTFRNKAQFMEREKVLRAAYGQLSDYEAESISPTTHPKYGYVHRNGYEITDTADGETIKVLKTGDPDNNGYWLVSGLIENQEQINHPTAFDTLRNWPKEYYYSDVKTAGYRLFIMPRMRIDTADAFLVTPKKVCRIVVIPFDGDTTDGNTLKIDLWTNHFRFSDGSYDGSYLDLYYDNLHILRQLNILASFLNRNNPHDSDGKSSNPSASKVDYRIYWYGQVNLWLDKVRVADEWAFYLFNPELEPSPKKYDFKTKIQHECDSIGNHPNFGYFYIDEYMFNSLPCIAEVNRLIKQYKPNSGIIAESNISLIGKYSGLVYEVPPDSVYERLVRSKAVTDILFMYQYPFTYKQPEGGNMSLFPLPQNVTLPLISTYPGTIGYYNSANNQEYNDTINYWFENDFESGYGHNYCIIDQYRRSANLQKKYNYNPQIIFCAGNQSHSFESDILNTPHGVDREPTNEEIRVQNYLSLAYGARIILNFQFTTYFFQDITTGNKYYDWGMDSEDHHSPRNLNYYGQKKYDSIKILNQNLQNIGKIMYEDNNFAWDDSRTVDKDDSPFKYFNSFILKSYFRNSSSTWEYNSQYEDVKKYWEIGVFNNNSSMNYYKYFILVNKRCAPELNSLGDVRQVRLYFDSTQLQGFNNWILKDLSTNYIVTFDKHNTNGVLFPYDILPGEGKLFQLAPVMKEGGTLVCDEAPAPGSFTCDSTVFNNGYNITLYPSTTISFNPNGKIVMVGGNFITGSYASSLSSQPPVILKGNGNRWEGLNLTNCNMIKIGATNFSDIYYDGSSEEHQNSAIDIQNCYDFCIRGCNFDLSNEASAVNILIDNSNSGWGNAYIGYNNFTYSENSQCPFNIYSLAAMVTPLYICNNNLNNEEQLIYTPAMIINGVTGGTIRNNIITNFKYGIKMLASTIDLFNNYIYSNIESSDGFFGSSGSNVNMTPNLGYYTGGNNHIVTANSSGKNINVNNSFFNIKLGGNLFNISSSSNSYHMYGTFPDGNHSVQEAQSNCFQEDTLYVYPVYQLYWGETADTVEFKFGNTVCEDNPSQDYEVFTFSNANNDTVYKTGTGSGGGMKGFEDEQMNTESNYSKIYDSLNINVRKRNYLIIETQSKYLLTNYPDSVKTLSAINWLYYAIISRDSITNRMTSLKTYYETIILNNSNNEALIDRTFYFIQKCKVALKQYQSAMAGFQLIINEHPYSFEGLVASWDYAATHLLDSLGGYGGGVKNQILNIKNKKISEENLNFEGENELLDLEIYLDNFMSNYDSTKFSKSDRVKLYDNTKKSFEKKKKKDIEIINDLKKRSEKGDKTATRELQTKKAINDAVKVKKPRTQIELKKIISNDVNKIFATVKETKNKETNIIPKEFSLYQNYPNPFNPVTKISFDLPKDSKVKLIIYDILGREITRLLNSEFKPAGKYIVEFNAVNLNLASGVYFYRIETDKFIAVKKMLLIK